MSVEEFMESPWKKSHSAYERAIFAPGVSPEFATAEVMLASTYRAVGFSGVNEKDIPAAGRTFDRAAARGRKGRIGPDAWKTVLHGALQSPKLKQQSAKRFLQLSPVVPDTALYSGSARLAGSPWNPGKLTAWIVGLGSASQAEAEDLWGRLFDGLSVSQDDDVWARWLEQEFSERRSAEREWKLRPIDEAPHFSAEERARLKLPAHQFGRDLRAVLQAKRLMTRRQWVSIVESVIRLGAVAHVLWVCETQTRLWELTRAIMNGSDVPDDGECLNQVFNGLGRPLVYGATALPKLREMVSRYLAARLGLNLVLWQLEAAGQPVRSLASGDAVIAMLHAVSKRRQQLKTADVIGKYDELYDRHPRELSCKKGLGNNMIEFCRHALGQRQTADETLRGYDQGYQMRKKAEYATAPWIVSLGPVALLAFTHCCLLEAASPRSITRLCEHLEWYGIEVDRDDIAESEIGMTLRMLGLVLDSPDAESGMLLVPPFEMPVADTGAI
jgi:hypothetical protein